MPKRKGRDKNSTSPIQTPDEAADSYKVQFDGVTYYLAVSNVLDRIRDNENANEKLREVADAVYQILIKSSAKSKEPSHYPNIVIRQHILNKAKYKAAVNTILDQRDADHRERLDWERIAEEIFEALKLEGEKKERHKRFVKAEHDRVMLDMHRQFQDRVKSQYFRRTELLENEHAEAKARRQHLELDHIVLRNKSINNVVGEMAEREILQKKEGREEREHADISVEKMPEASWELSAKEIIISAIPYLKTNEEYQEVQEALKQKARELGAQEPKNQPPSSGTSLSHETDFQQLKEVVVQNANLDELRELDVLIKLKQQQTPERGPAISLILIKNKVGEIYFAERWREDGKLKTRGLKQTLDSDYPFPTRKISPKVWQHIRQVMPWVKIPIPDLE